MWHYYIMGMGGLNVVQEFNFHVTTNYIVIVMLYIIYPHATTMTDSTLHMNAIKKKSV